MVGLLSIALAIAIANLWFAAARSTIPLPLDDVVVERKVLTEKHPGIDDVHIVVLGSGAIMQVDQPVFEEFQTGQRVTKHAWSAQLRSGDRLIDLTWSADSRGLMVVMPGVLLAIAATLAAIRIASPKL